MLAVFFLYSGTAAMLMQQTQPASQPASQPSIQELTSLIFYALVLLLLFIIGSYVMVRISRRFRDSIVRDTPSATDTTDIWAMHKVPEDYTDLEEREDGRAGEDRKRGDGNGDNK